MFCVKLFKAVFKGKRNILTVITAAACLIAIMQLATIVFFNLFQFKSHLGTDASIDVLRVLEKYAPLYEGGGGGILTSNSGVQPLAFINSLGLLLCGGDAFVYFGLRNVVTTIIIIAILFGIFNKLEVSPLAGIIVLNVILCPFITLNYNVSNDIGYYSCMFIGAAFYSRRIIAEMLVLYNTMALTKGGKVNYPLLIISGILVVHFAANMGMVMMLNIVAPMLVFVICNAFIKNDVKQLFAKQSIYVVSLAVLMLITMFVVKAVLKKGSKDDKETLVMITHLWTNIYSVFCGLASIFGIAPTKTEATVTSAEGIQYITNIVIFAVFIISFVFYIIKLFKKSETAKRYLPVFCATVTVFVIQCLISPLYENEIEIRGERYLIPVFLSGALLMAYFIDEIKENGTFKRFGTGVLACAVAFSSVCSYKVYAERQLNMDTVEEIIEKIKEYDSPVVFGWGQTYCFGLTTAANMAELMRTYDHTRVYRGITREFNCQPLFGTYNYYEDNAFAETDSMVMSTAEDFKKLPEFIKNKYELVYTNEETNASLYYSELNPFDLSSAVNNGKNREFMYSSGIKTALGEFDENGFFVTDGTAGTAIDGVATDSGEYAAEKGIYNITLCYEVLSYAGEAQAEFTVMTGEEKTVVGSASLSKGSGFVTVENVEIPDDEYELRYKVDVPEGARIILKTIEIVSVDAG